MPRSEWIACGGETEGVFPPQSRPAAGAAERELSLAAAERQIRADIACLGWSARYRVLDPADPTAAQCALWDGDGEEVPFGLGSGKGWSGQARVGAQYEALEHALSGPLALDDLSLRLRSPSELLDGALAYDRAVRAIADQTDAGVACLPYTALDDGDGLDIPLFLWATWYVARTQEMASRRAELADTADYVPILSYSGNTGCAIGASYDEAVLHAVNEWAERDGLSLFLLRSIYDRGPMPGRIDEAQLPDALRDQFERATALLGGPVILLDLTTDLGIPVVAAYSPTHSDDALASYGMGASQSGVTAVERALTEIVQGELLSRVVRERDGVPSAASTSAMPGQPTFAELIADHDIASDVRRRLRAYPRLLACAELDFAKRLPEVVLTDLPADTVPPGSDVAKQRSAAVERIAGAGYRVVAHTLRTLPNGTTLVQVQCPGLERFHLITKGHLALPGPRGRAVRATSQTV